MDLYRHMGEELRSLFTDVFDPQHARIVRQKMARILALARQIGGPIRDEAEQLYGDVTGYLDDRENPERIALLKEHALRLEQETRDL